MMIHTENTLAENTLAENTLTENTLEELLIKKRTLLGLSIDEVSDAIKIRPKYLIALEQGDTTEMPSPAYSIGYMRSYANFLGLNAEDMVTRLKASHARLNIQSELYVPEQYNEFFRPSAFIIGCTVFFILILYGSWYSIWHKHDAYRTEISTISTTLRDASFIGSLSTTPPSLMRKESLDYTISPLLIENDTPNNARYALFAKHNSWITINNEEGSTSEHYMRSGEWYFIYQSGKVLVAGNPAAIEVIDLTGQVRAEDEPIK